MYNNSQFSFVEEFVANVAAAGIEEPVFLFGGEDKWAQDIFEPSFASIPGPDGPVVLRIMVRSAQSHRETGWELFEHLRSDTVGAVQQLRAGGTIDSMGNLETIPPYTHNGKSYPAGRIIMGSWGADVPLIFDFLKAQEAQAPLLLDTIWLGVGHVDEFLQFLPADNERGWVLMINDPLEALEMFQNAADSGHGGVRAFSRPNISTDPPFCLPEQTINELLAVTDFTENNKKAAARIDANIAILKRETGLTDDEIIRVPSLFHYISTPALSCGNPNPGAPGNSTDSGEVRSDLAERTALRLPGGPNSKAKSIIEAATPPNAASVQGLTRRQTSFGPQLVSVFPGSINNVVLTDSLVLAPNPWGPVIDGKDILAEAVSAAYAKAGFNVTYQDDWFSHHLLNGEIHCGSNVWRETGEAWW